MKTRTPVLCGAPMSLTAQACACWVCGCTQYAHQQELDMIPLMMQADYKPTGWRKSGQTLVLYARARIILAVVLFGFLLLLQ